MGKGFRASYEITISLSLTMRDHIDHCKNRIANGHALSDDEAVRQASILALPPGVVRDHLSLKFRCGEQTQPFDVGVIVDLLNSSVHMVDDSAFRALEQKIGPGRAPGHVFQIVSGKIDSGKRNHFITVFSDMLTMLNTKLEREAPKMRTVYHGIHNVDVVEDLIDMLVLSPIVDRKVIATLATTLITPGDHDLAINILGKRLGLRDYQRERLPAFAEKYRTLDLESWAALLAEMDELNPPTELTDWHPYDQPAEMAIWMAQDNYMELSSSALLVVGSPLARKAREAKLQALDNPQWVSTWFTTTAKECTGLYQ